MRILRIPCATPQHAIDAQAALTARRIDVTGIDGRYLLVPAGWSPLFVWDLAVQMEKYGHDDELARWATDASSPRVGA